MRKVLVLATVCVAIAAVAVLYVWPQQKAHRALNALCARMVTDNVVLSAVVDGEEHCACFERRAMERIGSAHEVLDVMVFGERLVQVVVSPTPDFTQLMKHVTPDRAANITHLMLANKDCLLGE